MEEQELKKVIETLLFITDEPIKTEKIAKICEVKDIKYVEEKLEEIKHSYDMENRALAIMKVAGGWQMSTRSDYSIWVRKLYQTRLIMRLSNAALETLCIIAYKQPVTRAHIERVRGVDSMGPIETLIERKLVYSPGRAETPGRPLIFATTDEFLRQFGLNSLSDLPPLDNMISKESIDKINEIVSENVNPDQPTMFENTNENLNKDSVLNEDKNENPDLKSSASENEIKTEE